jgi:hypothetical protein
VIFWSVASAFPSSESGSSSAAIVPSRPWPVFVHHHVAELGARAPVSPVEPAVQDEAAADPGPDGEPDYVARALRRPEPRFDERRDVAVVVDEDRQPEPLVHYVAEGKVLDIEVHSDHGNPGCLIDQAGNPESDRVDVRHLRAELLDGGRGGLDHLRLLHAAHFAQDSCVDLEVLVDYAAEQLRAP